MNWYKIAQNIKSVSFDFDGTIALNVWNNEDLDYERDEKSKIILTPNDYIINLMRQYRSQGYKVFVVSSRIEEYKQEIIDFLNKYNVPYDECHVTNSRYKAQTLKDLNVQVHYDDDEREIEKIKEIGINGYRV